MIGKLIINADDFGLTGGVNRGIIDCHEAGVVTSTTLMVGGDAADEAARLAARHPRLGVGLHLNLTAGRPVSPPDRVPSLVDRRGGFPGRRRALLWLSAGRARTRELEIEIDGQIERCRRLGVEPTHIDSHHNLHVHPRLRSVIQRVCRRQGISKARAYRALSPAGSVGAFLVSVLALAPPGLALAAPDSLLGLEPSVSRDYAASLARAIDRRVGTLELMCHPGYCDASLRAVSSYNIEREAELRSLLSPELGRLLAQAGVELVSYREL
ncbi:MAG: carbohydrate deacetylase [Thermoleophilia bacterium]